MSGLHAPESGRDTSENAVSKTGSVSRLSTAESPDLWGDPVSIEANPESIEAERVEHEHDDAIMGPEPYSAASTHARTLIAWIPRRGCGGHARARP